MVKPVACPPEGTLKDLIEGKINEPQLSELSEHLEACGGCQEKAKTLSPFDTFVEPLRIDAEAAQKIADGIPQPLLERVKNIARGEAPTGSETVAVPEDQLTQGPGQIDLSFLGAPQQPDEIGRLGTYRILHVLGMGGMGMVFLAEDPELDRKVALKVMLPKIAAHPAAKQRFLREARAAAKLRNDHVVTIHQVSEDRGVPFLAMELLDGQPLDEQLQSGQSLAMGEILRIGREIAQGLAAAHEKGLIHRDIKPANIWLDRAHGNRVKILDFGLARQESDEVHLTQSGAIVGTPAYMAPEQGRGEKNVDARADLFSLGCVLYRLCAGDIPFKGETTMGVLTALAVHEPTPPHKISNTVPRALSEFIMQLLEKDPARRPASARDVITRLAEIERTLSADDTRVTAAQPLPRMSADTTVSLPSIATPTMRRRRPWAFAISIGFMAAIVALLGGILYIVTDNGTIEIKTEDKNVKVIVEEAGGKVTVLDPLTKQTYVINTGKYTIKLGDGADALEIDMPKERTFEMKRGGIVVVSIRKIAGPIGPTAYALSFGPEDAVELSDLRIDDTGPFTVECYVVAETPGNIFGDEGYMNISRGARGWNCSWSKPSTNSHVLLRSTDDRPGVRAHVAAVRAGNDYRLFVDGKMVAEKKLDTPLPSFSTAKFFLGKQRNKSANFTGVMTEVRISKVARYEKGFTPQIRFAPDKDTLALYHFDEGQGAKLIDSSGNGHHGKIVGAKWVKADGAPVGDPFFAGTAMNGWQEGNGAWRIENGELIGTLAGSRLGKTRVRDFRLQFDAKAIGGAFLVVRGQKGEPGQIVGFNGGVWNNVWKDASVPSPDKGADGYKREEYNQTKVTLVGKRLTVHVNGVLASDGEYSIPAEGGLFWMMGGDGKELRVKNVRFEELSKPIAAIERAGSILDWIIQSGGHVILDNGVMIKSTAELGPTSRIKQLGFDSTKMKIPGANAQTGAGFGEAIAAQLKDLSVEAWSNESRVFSYGPGPITPQGWAALMDVESIRAVTGLSLAATSITPVLPHLARLTQLRSCWLNHVPLTQADLKQLTGQPRLEKLELLGSSSAALDAALLGELKLDRLTYLEIADAPKLKDDAIPVFTAMKLKSLLLRRTGFSADGVKKLVTAMPNCKITVDDKLRGP